MPSLQTHPPSSFCWFELGTTDQNAAKQFYTSLFGWTANDYPMGPSDFYTMFQLTGADAAAAYTLREDQRQHGVPPHWMIYIAVENADQTAARAGQLGATVLAAPFDVAEHGRMAVLQDPTGAAFSIWQPKQHPGTGVSRTDGTVCWADLSTGDPAKAAQFYEALFGWSVKPGEHDSSGYLHIQNRGEFIGGIPPAALRNSQIPPHWLLYFQTSNCDQTAKNAAQAGATLHVAPMTIPNVGRMSVIADPQGAVFAIFQDKSTL
ncbi:MAG: VOC family protein [Acidobacteriaceae bacterium]|nr:VOC family protein [Acidobacteriaceae bacterium]MBV9498548.1 VOC family protein [Acidobacteriaceae bacterium]